MKKYRTTISIEILGDSPYNNGQPVDYFDLHGIVDDIMEDYLKAKISSKHDEVEIKEEKE